MFSIRQGHFGESWQSQTRRSSSKISMQRRKKKKSNVATKLKSAVFTLSKNVCTTFSSDSERERERGGARITGKSRGGSCVQLHETMTVRARARARGPTAHRAIWLGRFPPARAREGLWGISISSGRRKGGNFLGKTRGTTGREKILREERQERPTRGGEERAPRALLRLYIYTRTRSRLPSIADVSVGILFIFIHTIQFIKVERWYRMIC